MPHCIQTVHVKRCMAPAALANRACDPSPPRCVLAFVSLAAMPQIRLTVHPDGLHPIEAVKAYLKHTDGDMSLDQIVSEGEVLNLSGEVAGRKAVYNAIKRVREMDPAELVPKTKYARCGRKPALTEDQRRAVVEFVEQWRHKCFCTCHYIRNALGLTVTPRTVNNVLNNAGFHWKPVPRMQNLSHEQLAKRKQWVDDHVNHPPSWWEQHMGMVLDGVTLTMPPKTLHGRQKHAAQRITMQWMRAGERLDNDLHTFNRYGVQLGTKVALWGGFTGNGRFTLRLWTPKPKMTSQEWAALVPTVMAAVQEAYGDNVPSTPWVWHDNERFLQCPEVYRENGMSLHRFPPNSGDLNPIENVWAWLRRDLGVRERADITARRSLTPLQFKQRCSQILNSYCTPKPGELYSRIQKLIRGMPKRLRKCRDNRYGRSGK